MKKLFYLASVIMFTLSCQNNQEHIEEVELTQPLTVTARFDNSTTRVAFAEESKNIVPSWEIGDRIFGFWDDKTLTYEVASVNDEGTASFNLVSGTEPTDGKTVYMIYAPSKSVSDLSTKTLAVDYSTQDGTLANMKNHAYMCATATVSGTTLTLSFTNQMVIVCFKRLTGLAPSTTYTTLEFSTVGEGSIIQVDGGVLKLVPGSTYGPVSINGSFTSDASGNLSTPIYLAIPCPSVAVSPSITLKNSTSQRVGFISSKTMTPGKYYYITTKQLYEPIMYDDFESETAGTFPSSQWYIIYDGQGTGYQVIVNNMYRNGGQSFKLEGKSSWSASIGSKNTDASTFNHSRLVYQAYVRASRVGSGENGGIGFINPDLGSWGHYQARIEFSNNSIMAFRYPDGPNFNTVTPETNKWYHIRIVCDKTAGTFQVYIDGTLVSGTNTSDSSDTRNAFPMGTTDISKLLLTAGNATSTVTYFDDVIAYAIE